ncbi:hypothetical protein [Thalassospira povalilytica]|uniref:hypothetical protein n=1 Tax=Thalassospira povalilytica TaxID=732237 RepID=UPI001479418B|nr:hypothetical protein [Thalassospira povalilytica]
MTKKSWNNFTIDHPNAYQISCVCPPALPTRIKFDNSGKRLPTPYGLFCEWLKTQISGEWATTKAGKIFMIKVSNKNDLQKILSAYQSKKIATQPGSSASYQTMYSTLDYGPLARHLGYDI